MSNALAYLMLWIWPLVAWRLFTRLPASQALLWTMIAGYLVLPSRFAIDLPIPGLPLLSRDTVPAMSAMAMLLMGVTQERRGSARGAPAPAAPAEPLPGWLPAGMLGKALIVIAILSPMASSLMNGDPIRFAAGNTIRGLTAYEGANGVVAAMTTLLPLLLARRYLSGRDDHRRLLQVLVAGAVVYTAPALIEMWISPQFHRLVYGYFPSSFLQTSRFGGWRPQVFLEHGLRLALFFALAVMAAAALRRVADRDTRFRATAILLWLVLILVACRSVGAVVLVAAFLPAALLLGPRSLILLSAGLVVIVLLYPAIRSAGLVPVQDIMQLAGSKAGSLKLRFTNEDQLLARAALRPLFGWGPWGRARVYDPVTGDDLSVTDGAWIITLGAYGWAGYAARFGLMTLPVLMLLRKRGSGDLTLETAILSLMLALNMVDQLPNSSQIPLTWLMAGALLGRAERLGARAPAGRQSRTPRAPRTGRGADPGAPDPDLPPDAPPGPPARGVPGAGRADGPRGPRSETRPRPTRPLGTGPMRSAAPPRR